MLTKKECEKIIKFRNEHRYSLRNGEYARPDSRVRKHRGTEDYGITTKYFFYDSAFGTPKDGFEDEEELVQELNCINMVESRQNE